MDWQAIGTIVALVGLIATLILTIRGQKQERQIAEATASRAEAAARLTEGYSERVVIALESLAGKGVGHGAVLPAVVRWAMRHQAGDAYVLENIGGAAATGVEIEGHATLGRLLRTSGGPDLAPGEAMTFMAAPSLATSDFTITVNYRTGDGEQHHWRYPLPFGT